jgi:hypothetical protein
MRHPEIGGKTARKNYSFGGFSCTSFSKEAAK